MSERTLTDDDLRRLQERFQGRRQVPPEGPMPEPASMRCKVCGKPIGFTGPTTDRQIVEGWNRLAAGPPRFTCQDCCEAAEAAEHEQQIAAMKRARQRELEAIRAAPDVALLGVGVPSHWQHASFDRCPDLPANLVETVRGWAASPRGVLYLFGFVGAGKTFLAVATLRHVLTEGVIRPSGALFISERSFLDDLKASFDADAHAAPVADRMLPVAHPRRIALLVYDDLGAARQTDWTRGEIAGLLESRHAADLPTVITSNLAPNALAQAIDGRVASRVAESRSMIEFPRRDLRVTGTIGGLPA
jgi:DNA replication protein DnaC